MTTVAIVVVGLFLLVLCAGQRFGIVVNCAAWVLLSAVADEPQPVGVVGGAILAVESLRTVQVPGRSRPVFSLLLVRLAQASLCMQEKTWPQRLSLALTIASVHLGCSSVLPIGPVIVLATAASTQTDAQSRPTAPSCTTRRATGATETEAHETARGPAAGVADESVSSPSLATGALDAANTPSSAEFELQHSFWFEVQQKSDESWQPRCWMDEKMKPCTQQPPPGAVPGSWQYAVALFRKDRYWTQLAGGKSVRRRRWQHPR
mmetsp:Transcript_60071/g.161022  ORF Transcript_60071/g.161022 Transcript_60071/m.161022 type:complete len:263 (-) Transcript_60071:15-803(-)